MPLLDTDSQTRYKFAVNKPHSWERDALFFDLTNTRNENSLLTTRANACPARVLVGLLGNETPDSNRLTRVPPNQNSASRAFGGE